ncbi:sensor histidine kinase [Cohnella hongkongensis]|uniref:histidine kinase n=1 Tax=Cohnella hongkongensis TaxID=178337 RepID=A0ABV9F7Q2_9BACL
MRKLRIRTFTLICFLFILTLPWIFYVAAHVMENGTLTLSSSRSREERLQQPFTETIRLIESGTERWTDPDWHNELQEQLREASLDAAILSPSGQEIYRSAPERRGPLSSTERFSVVADGELIGRVVLYGSKSSTVPLISLFAGVLLAFIVVGFAMRRLLLQPLERMSAAARQLAGGDWEVRLPASAIAEIADVRDGFGEMVNGLRNSYRKQAELEEERRFVIAAVAHDLRTPLFALRGYLDGLEQGIARSPEKMAKYLAVCKEKSAQLDRLVEELFTLAKLEYGETPLHAETVDLAIVLRKAMDSLKPSARRKRISIHDRTEDGCCIKGDAHLLERAMSNLLDNAVRHTPPDGEIVVRCGRDGNRILFAVQDTGPGFDAEELERAFEPLYRGEESRNRSTGGSGLGLTIAQKLIKRHGGELNASNAAEGGALLAGGFPAAAADEGGA